MKLTFTLDVPEPLWDLLTALARPPATNGLAEQMRALRDDVSCHLWNLHARIDGLSKQVEDPEPVAVGAAPPHAWPRA